MEPKPLTPEEIVRRIEARGVKLCPGGYCDGSSEDHPLREISGEGELEESVIAHPDLWVHVLERKADVVRYLRKRSAAMQAWRREENTRVWKHSVLEAVLAIHEATLAERDRDDPYDAPEEVRATLHWFSCETIEWALAQATDLNAPELASRLKEARAEVRSHERGTSARHEAGARTRDDEDRKRRHLEKRRTWSYAVARAAVAMSEVFDNNDYLGAKRPEAPDEVASTSAMFSSNIFEWALVQAADPIIADLVPRLAEAYHRGRTYEEENSQQGNCVGDRSALTDWHRADRALKELKESCSGDDGEWKPRCPDA